MGRLTRLTGGTVTAAEGGQGKRIGLLALAAIGLFLALRLRGGKAEEDDDGIDTIRTDDDGPETVHIGEGETDDGEEAAESDAEADDGEAEADTEESEQAETEDVESSGGISVEAIDRRDLDLFDVIAIVGEGLRAAREEYDRRAA
jgi:hypothetical protein